uniref:Aldo_ket_red domain-containing protein n=1 Tax=Panagrellus redivivus TaxID=6233 RepID=A0A7E4VRQ8_PANRE
MTVPKTLTLSNGVEMPIFGLGTWQSKPEEVVAAVKAAVKDGYRLIDTAAGYLNEDAIGQALQELFAEGVVKRDELFITTKCPPDELGPDAIEASLRESLKKLKLDQVDLYLAHMPGAFDKDFKQLHEVKVEDIWRTLEGLYEKKLTRAIGISNYSIAQVDRILKVAKVPIHNHQVELHLYFQQKALVEHAKQHNITVTAYAPIGSPGRAAFVLPNGYKPEWPAAPSPLEDQEVAALATKYSKSPAQILLRHLLQKGIAIIPKSIHEARIIENNRIWDFELTAEEVAKLDSAPQNPRLFWQDFLVGHPEDPFKEEREQKA